MNTERAVVIGVVVALSALGVNQAAQDRELAEWQRCTRTNTAEAYATFYTTFPQTSRKVEIRTKVDTLIVAAVAKEVNDNNAKVSLCGIGGSHVLPVQVAEGGPVAPVSARFTIGGGKLTMGRELAVGPELVFLADPTEPLALTAYYSQQRRLSGARVLSGRGVLIQHLVDETYVYVFGVDVSAVVSAYHKWNTTPADWGEKDGCAPAGRGTQGKRDRSQE